MTRKLDDHFTAANMIDRETLRDMAVAEGRPSDSKYQRPSTSLPTVHGKSSGKRGENILEARPVEPVPGIAIMDQMMAAEDKLWRRELAQRLGVKEPRKDEPPSAA